MVENNDAPYHAHIYYTTDERDAAAALREEFRSDPSVLFVGKMTDRPVGPHPIAQLEIHFLKKTREAIIATIIPTGLRALVHPLTHDDLADHTTLGYWIGEPVELELSVLDPAGQNKGVARFGGKSF
jgi:aromatic ring-cleaving dioxygenase